MAREPGARILNKRRLQIKVRRRSQRGTVPTSGPPVLAACQPVVMRNNPPYLNEPRHKGRGPGCRFAWPLRRGCVLLPADDHEAGPTST